MVLPGVPNLPAGLTFFREATMDPSSRERSQLFSGVIINYTVFFPYRKVTKRLTAQFYGVKILPKVKLDHLPDTHSVDVVGAEDKDQVRILPLNEIEILGDSVCGSLKPFRA